MPTANMISLPVALIIMALAGCGQRAPTVSTALSAAGAAAASNLSVAQNEAVVAAARQMLADAAARVHTLKSR
ncbi:MAG: hypothetical protein KKB37_16380, partial [Alphaproteobacteria bacterium]|nr:hypothetical protein [Alphaproteobacteria bacterium]